jgi:hypothetical protein
MTAAAIRELMADLIIFIVGSTSYSSTSALPEVLPIARPELEQRVCGKPCPVFALFVPEQGILLDDRLDLLADTAAQSVLLHELVHYLQWQATGRRATKCDEWLAREREAYRTQFAWLSTRDFEWRKSPLPRPNLSLIRCRTGPVQAWGNPGPHLHRGGPPDDPGRRAAPGGPGSH